MTPAVRTCFLKNLHNNCFPTQVDCLTCLDPSGHLLDTWISDVHIVIEVSKDHSRQFLTPRAIQLDTPRHIKAPLDSIKTHLDTFAIPRDSLIFFICFDHSFSAFSFQGGCMKAHITCMSL